MRVAVGYRSVGMALLLLGSAHSQNASRKLPFFSSRGIDIYLGGTASSPDGKNVVSLRVLDGDGKDFPSLVTVTTPQGKITSKIAFGLNAQVLWNADSTGFAVTGSSEGANGRYHTSSFSLRNDHLVQVPLTRTVERAFGHPMKCGWPEAPNVSAVKWLDHRRLLVAAQIVNHSNCDCFGTFKGYVVDVLDRSILRAYDQLQVKERFHSDLGPWLQDANDDWVRNPKSCYVAENHPALHLPQ